MRGDTRKLGDSDVQLGLAPMMYRMLTLQDNIKITIKVKLKYNLYQAT